jgi:hypothetical protein
MLNTREVTQAMHDANRANSQKSTGPRTEKRKRNSRRNAFKHGLDSHELCPWAEELAEDSSQYRSFHRRFLQAFQVSDPVEALLVSDLARTQWRLDRVLHAESAYLAYHRAKLDNDFRRKLAGEGMDIRAAFENILVREAGYKSLADSEGKFEFIFLFLSTVRTEAENEGYTDLGRLGLRVVYGPQTGVNKGHLLSDYERLQSKEGRSAAEQECLRQDFLTKLQAEVGNFQTLRECMRQERGELFDMQKDTKLLLSSKAAKRVAAEETRLRNYFHQTMKQLMGWRQRAAQDGPPPAGSGPHEGPAPSVDGARPPSSSPAGGEAPGERVAAAHDETPAPPPASLPQDQAAGPWGADLPTVAGGSQADNERSEDETAGPDPPILPEALRLRYTGKKEKSCEGPAAPELPERLRPGG